MTSRRDDCCSRREVLSTFALAGTAGLVGTPMSPVTAAPPPETSKVRILRLDDATCVAPQYVAEDLLRAEGFAEVNYVRGISGLWPSEQLAKGQADFVQAYVAQHVMRTDAGDRVLALAGVHGGCAELVARDGIRSVRDLRGKTIAFTGLNDPIYGHAAAILSYVGLDHRRDVRWSIHSRANSVGLLAEGKIDAFLALPPYAQELRARKIGRVLVSFTADRPWSHYFCCMLLANPDFVRKHPVATHRVVRAMMKALAVCAREPERVAEILLDQAVEYRREYAVQALREIPFAQWRTFDAADTIRFYSLRLQEAGLIKSSPQQILANGSDWRFLNELKRELRG